MTNEAMHEQAARMVHELSRAYCLTIGDDVAPPWDETSKIRRTIVMMGIQFSLENPQASQERMHQNWMEAYRKIGWTVGESRDEVKKTHPHLVPYDQLPEEQKPKDRFIQAVLYCLGQIEAPPA